MNPGLSALIGQHFAFANGRIGVLQQLLLEQSDVDRLLGSGDIRDCEKIMTELHITNPIDQGMNSGDEMLHALEEWIRKEVKLMSTIDKQPTFHILWLAGDAPLLKYLIKKHHGLTSEISTPPSSGLSAYDPETLSALVEEGADGTLPSHLVRFVQEMKDLKEPAPQEIDTAVAQYVATLQLKLARASGSADIRDFVRHSVDLMNIRSTLRFTDESPEERRALLLDGGTIAPEELCGPAEQVQKAVDRSPIAFTLTSDLLEKGDDPSALERALSDVLAMDIAKMWNVPLSIEPLFAFAAIAVTQLRVIRAVLIGKRNDLAPQEIKKMLPPFLSALHYLG